MSVWRFTQAPEKAVVPVAQLVEHVPLEQTCPVAQALPQLPQFAESEVVSMHVVLPVHRTRPVVQAQLLLWQVLSLAQAFPHVPQLALSVAGVMQVAPHNRVPVAHVGPPVPAAPEVPAVPPPEVPAAPPPKVPAVPSPEMPAAPPLIPVPPFPPPVPLDGPDENEPQESTMAPRDTTTATGTRERMVFIETSPVSRSPDGLRGEPLGVVSRAQRGPSHQRASNF
jgi:hypothetical protein